LRAIKARYLSAASADGAAGRRSTGVRWWIIFCVYGMQLSPIPDPRRLAVDREYQEAVEDLLEDMCVWICDSRPSGRQVSAESCKKYVSSVRAWYRRCYRATLGLGASGSRIADVLKG
jgi:hypothetical protein